MIIGGVKHLHFTHFCLVSTSSFRLTFILPNSQVSPLSSLDFKSDGTILSLSDAIKNHYE